VRNHAWQLALAWDTRRNFRAGLPPGAGGLTALARYDRWLDPLTDHAAGRLAAAALTWCWLRVRCRQS